MDAPSGADHIYQGRLGRTSKTSVLISSEAGPVFPASVYTGINVHEDPALHEALVAQTLNRVECPFSPGRTYALALPLRYHDPDRRVFALIIPEALRHEEFKHRGELLQELAKERELLPEYVRHFQVSFGGPPPAQALAPMPVAAPALQAPPSDPAQPSLPGPQALLGSGAAQIAAQVTAQVTAERQALEQARQALEEQRQELDQEKQQLAQVSERLDRERERMEQIELKNVSERDRLAQERQALELASQELEAQRLKLLAQELNLEQARLQQANQPLEPEPVEKTQIVTEDQFIEIMGESAERAEHEPLLDEQEILDVVSIAAPSPSASMLLREVPLEESGEHLGPDEQTFVTRLPLPEGPSVPPRFDAQLGAGQDYYVSSAQGHVLAAYRAPRKQVDALLAEGRSPSLLVQYHVLENYPLIALTVAQLNEQQQPVAAFSWPLDLALERDQAVIQALMQRVAVRVAFYEPSGKLLRFIDLSAPLEQNVRWIKAQADAYWSDPRRKSGRFGKAADAFMAPDHERIGSMRHPFQEQSFAQIERPSQAKLAAGIVGYWSSGDVFEYLVANRAFPLVSFEAIQRRVIERAMHFGIYLNAALRQRAMATGVTSDERALTRHLLASFAEVCAGLRANDLDPVEQWENWDVLLNLCSELSVQPDEEIVKLAQASLERAQLYEDELADDEDSSSSLSEEPVEELGEDDYELEEAFDAGAPAGAPAALAVSEPEDALVVARHSESTGVTYFLPDQDILDSFDDLSAMSKEDLISLLDDARGRLEASQMLIERFGASVLGEVLGRAEELQGPQLVALTRFVESKADGLEGSLVRALESAGPSATYVVTHALTRIASSSAIPALLDALRDPKRQSARQALARAMASYGERLMPALMRIIKNDGHDDALALLLFELDRRDPGLLNRLAKDRHRRVREAAKDARRFA